jgi:tetratricopeptide (TPR) repeat protein
MKMATQGISRSPNQKAGFRPNALAFWLVGFAAAALSLAAAFVGLSSDRSGSPTTLPNGPAELAARNTRILFFEDRVRHDTIDYLSFNTLAAEYLQRARETGDVADYERAATAADRSLEAVPENYAGLVLAAQVALAQHNFRAALALTDRAVPIRPDFATAYGARGDAYVQLGRYAEAAKDFQEMVKLQPDLTAFSRLANLAYLRGDLFNATDFWKQALTSAKGLPVENQAWARVQLSVQYFDQGDLKNAEKQAGSALKLYPDYVHALAALGAVRAAQGRWDESIGLYRRAQELLPQVQYVVALGDVYAAAGRPDDARRQYDLVQAIDALYRANGINTDLQISLFYANHDFDDGAALTLARNNYAANPGIYAADGLAWALHKNGRDAEAVAPIEEALRLGTRDAALHFHAGMIYARLGNAAFARQHLALALGINAHFSLLQAGEARATLTGLETGPR